MAAQTKTQDKEEPAKTTGPEQRPEETPPPKKQPFHVTSLGGIVNTL